MDGSHRVHLSEADYIVEGEHEPLPVRSYCAPSETDIAIAKIVVNEIPDGAVLSLGVGGVPTRRISPATPAPFSMRSLSSTRQAS